MEKILPIPFVADIKGPVFVPCAGLVNHPSAVSHAFTNLSNFPI